MAHVYRFIFFCSMLLLNLFSTAQFCYDDEVCLDKTPRQLKREEQKGKLLNGLNKTLIYLSYVNFSDRSVDRILTGADEFEPYRGKMIHEVSVRVIKPYGVSIENPDNDHQKKFAKFANNIQVKTRDWVVRNDLLFKSGDKINPILFADTERNMWKRETFKDIKIFIEPVEGSDELVDVVVMVQDLFSWNIYTSVQYSKVVTGIQFKNFLGIPQSLSQYVSFNYRKDNFYSVYGNYYYENIKKSQVNIRAAYIYDNLLKDGSLKITRPFFSANSKWAGHIKAGVKREIASMPNPIGEIIPTNYLSNWQDVWLASAFKFTGKLGKRYDLQRLILSARLYRNQYIWRPFKHSPDGSQVYLNQTSFLGSIGFARWDYYVDHSVYYLGPAEYFSKGMSGTLILGFDYDEELQKRFYSGFQLNYGKFFPRFGYMSTYVSYGGFTKKDSYQQILFRFREQFYSAPVKLGNRFMMRLFVNFTANVGFNRPLGKEIIVNNKNGVRGIFVNYIRGDRSFVFNFETDVYPTFKILGFNSSAFAFADIAISQKGTSSSYTLTQAYGAGIRLRNLGLGIGFFEIAFAYFPNLSIPNMKPWAVTGGFDNLREIEQENLFVPQVLTTDN